MAKSYEEFRSWLQAHPGTRAQSFRAWSAEQLAQPAAPKFASTQELRTFYEAGAEAHGIPSPNPKPKRAHRRTRPLVRKPTRRQLLRALVAQHAAGFLGALVTIALGAIPVATIMLSRGSSADRLPKWLPQLLVWASILCIGAGGHAIIYGWDRLDHAGIAKRLGLMAAAFVVLGFAAPHVAKGQSIFSPIPIGPPQADSASSGSPFWVQGADGQLIGCSVRGGPVAAVGSVSWCPKPLDRAAATPTGTPAAAAQPAAPAAPKGKTPAKVSVPAPAAPKASCPPSAANGWVCNGAQSRAFGEPPAPWLPLCAKRPPVSWDCASPEA